VTVKTKCEAPALGAAIRRMLVALNRRAAEGDTEALEELIIIEQQCRKETDHALAKMREVYSLAELSRVTGTSRPAVLKRSRVGFVNGDPRGARISQPDAVP
jgi:hypothetical protein